MCNIWFCSLTKYITLLGHATSSLIIYLPFFLFSPFCLSFVTRTQPQAFLLGDVFLCVYVGVNVDVYAYGSEDMLIWGCAALCIWHYVCICMSLFSVSIWWHRKSWGIWENTMASPLTRVVALPTSSAAMHYSASWSEMVCHMSSELMRCRRWDSRWAVPMADCQSSWKYFEGSWESGWANVII